MKVGLCQQCGKEIVNRRPHAKYCSEYCGNKVRTGRWEPTSESQQRRLYLQKEKRKTPKYKYNAHKRGAMLRGIDFKLTFEEWWSLWEPHWTENQQGIVCMCRNNDEGAYEIGNVRIDTWTNNIREARNLPLK